MADSLIAVYAALAGNAAVAVTKIAVAALTGSSAMFSEGMHSVVDTGNEALLLWGRRRSLRPPDENHPFGHGQELYFWTLIVSLVIFAAGGAVSVYEGILRLLNPETPHPSKWNYIVLAVAAVFESISFVIGIRQFRKTYPNQGLLPVLKRSKDPTLMTVLIEDTADLAGLVIAFFGVLLSDRFRNSTFDGVASILIGALLMVMAVTLVRESRGLLTGESADPELRRGIVAILRADPGVHKASCPLTVHFGPDNILVAVDIQFHPGLSSGDVARVVDRLEQSIQSEFPTVRRIFIEADALLTGVNEPTR